METKKILSCSYIQKKIITKLQYHKTLKIQLSLTCVAQIS